MTTDFKNSAQHTIGVEIELQILDSTTLDLAPKSEILLEACQARNLERVKAEVHQSMVEVDTEISQNIKECSNYLKQRLERLNAIANDLGLRLAISGTHPFQKWENRLISRYDRYIKLLDKYQWLVRRMNVYGLHVHVGMKNGEQALAVSNALIQYLPHLLALSANSPFWHGVKTGMQSSRTSIMESFPNSGNPPIFESWSHFEYYLNTLKQAGAVESLKDLYWYIRPNLHFGTLEFRICDAMSTLDETMALVALIHCLAVHTAEKHEADGIDKRWSKEMHWIAPTNQWIAARDGLKGIIVTKVDGFKEMISESIEELLEKLQPIAKKLNSVDELDYIKKIIRHGNGAQRQLNTFDKTQSLHEVVSANVMEFESIFSLSDNRIAVN